MTTQPVNHSRAALAGISEEIEAHERRRVELGRNPTPDAEMEEWIHRSEIERLADDYNLILDALDDQDAVPTN